MCKPHMKSRNAKLWAAETGNYSFEDRLLSLPTAAAQGLKCDFSPRFVFRDDSAVIKERVEKIKQSVDGSASETTLRDDEVATRHEANPVGTPQRHVNIEFAPVNDVTRDGPEAAGNQGPSPRPNAPPAASPAMEESNEASYVDIENERAPVTSNHEVGDNSSDLRNASSLGAQKNNPASRRVRENSLLGQVEIGDPVALISLLDQNNSGSPLSPSAIASASISHSIEHASDHPSSNTPNPYGPFPIAWTPPLLNFTQILSDWRAAEIGYSLSPRISTQSPTETVELCDPSRQPIILRRWRTHLLPRMAPVLSRIDSFIEKYEVVKYAVLALGAAHMNQSETFGNKIQLESRQSHPEFYADGLAYYSQALESLGLQAREGENAMETTAQLVVVILCTYFEIGSGTFNGSYYHLQQIERTVISNHETIIKSPLGVELVIAWADLKAQHVTDCLPFRTSEAVSIFASEPQFRADLERNIALTSSDHAFIMLRLCTISRASDLLLLQLTVGCDSSSPLYRSWVSLMKQIGRWKTKSGFAAGNGSLDLYAIMDHERSLLDEWESSLSLSQRPAESFSSKDMMCTNVESSELRVRPLVFSSHHAAMNYLRYCCAQLYASRDNIQYCCNIGTPTMNDWANNRVDPWVMLCLRIAAGLDIHSCLTENMYELGVAWVLIQVSMRSCSIKVLEWIYNYLSKMENSGGSREGRLPINLVKRVLRQVMEEWHKGRVVQLVYTALEAYFEVQELCDIGAGGLTIQAVMLGRVQRNDDLGRTAMTDCEAFPFLDMVNVQ
ncbi:hypothetical protein PFICI_10799 [Pestalotiopsis fici W106-1]|uniref:Transcription factor domain-containing protein n=1 Tax=Pestalotiopsis fici (strain W106-1 / CGMCC3.15140) TaxID=1229662 RepID=W3WST9_PESFW|nr:uncharacterized protein PFICI_10799 [Pestalotiopsis fici W106-1]ETS76925.1 hypothetical protein PFICI_10799 [Pestalotiopsis fici W106-1]